MKGPDPGYAVELRRVTKRFGETLALDEISLQIRDGEFFSLLGPSGCGKTTSLRLMAGFEIPSEGEVLIGGVVQGQSFGQLHHPALRGRVGQAPLHSHQA